MAESKQGLCNICGGPIDCPPGGTWWHTESWDRVKARSAEAKATPNHVAYPRG